MMKFNQLNGCEKAHVNFYNFLVMLMALLLTTPHEIEVGFSLYSSLSLLRFSRSGWSYMSCEVYSNGMIFSRAMSTSTPTRCTYKISCQVRWQSNQLRYFVIIFTTCLLFSNMPINAWVYTYYIHLVCKFKVNNRHVFSSQDIKWCWMGIREYGYKLPTNLVAFSGTQIEKYTMPRKSQTRTHSCI